MFFALKNQVHLTFEATLIFDICFTDFEWVNLHLLMNHNGAHQELHVHI